jgi:Uma2 family endonuclease
MDREPELIDGPTGGSAAVDEYGDVDGCELIDGVWVPKHPDPDEPRPEEDRDGCELIDGVWVEKPMSSDSGQIEANLSLTAGAFARANGIGFFLGGSTMYRLFPTERPRSRRKPDWSFVRGERFPDGRVPRTPAHDFPPDLAVEIISPTDEAEAVETKLDEYLRAGVRLVWVLYVPTRHVWAYRPDGTARLYRSGDTLPGDDVLPGFTVQVDALFVGV